MSIVYFQFYTGFTAEAYDPTDAKLLKSWL